MSYFTRLKALFKAPPDPAPIAEWDDNEFEMVDTATIPAQEEIEASEFEIVNAADVPSQAEITKDRQPFAWTEQLAHTSTVAYGAKNRQDGDIINIREENGDVNQYRVVKATTRHAGLVGEILIPVNPRHDQTNQIYMSFTGTHSAATAVANLQSCAGELAFRDAEMDLLQQVNDAVGALVQQTGQKVNVVSTGHSLGGALAQLGFHAVERAIYSNLPESNPIAGFAAIPLQARDKLTADNIASLTVGAWNATGVLKTVETSSNEMAKPVQRSGVQLRGLFGLVAGDIVQQTGEGSVLTDVDSQVAEVRLLKINTGEEGRAKVAAAAAAATVAAAVVAPAPVALAAGLYLGAKTLQAGRGTLAAHTAKHFVREQSNVAVDFVMPQLRYEHFQNDSARGREAIRRKLTNKTRVINNPLSNGMKKGLYFAASRYVDTRPIYRPMVPATSALTVRRRAN